VLKAVSRHVAKPPADWLSTETISLPGEFRDTGRSVTRVVGWSGLLDLPYWATLVHRGGVRTTKRSRGATVI
jgi:hypothetical protein